MDQLLQQARGQLQGLVLTPPLEGMRRGLHHEERFGRNFCEVSDTRLTLADAGTAIRNLKVLSQQNSHQCHKRGDGIHGQPRTGPVTRATARTRLVANTRESCVNNGLRECIYLPLKS